MFDQIEENQIERRILKPGYIGYSPSAISTENTPNSHIYNNVLEEILLIVCLEVFFRLNFDVLDSATNNRYADGDDISLVNLGPIALFRI